MRRLPAALAALALASLGHATPEYWEQFQKTYGVKPGSAFAKAECSTCHTEVPKHNPYGVAVHDALKSAGTEKLTEAILRSVEKADSDGDGWSNGDEIAKSALPGDPKSRPAGAPPMAGMDHDGMAGMGKDEKGEAAPTAGGPDKGMEEGGMGHSHAATPGDGMLGMIPKHSFHPVLVHFPIALFIFGAFLELVGLRWRRPALREAGYWNLLAGSISTTVSIASGFTVALRMGYQLVPGTAVFTHLAVAILASLAMLATVLWRRKGAHVGWGYFSLLLLAAALVGLAGHFGGGMVYG